MPTDGNKISRANYNMTKIKINGTEDANKFSNIDASKEAIEFFTHLAGEDCPISPEQLFGLVYYVCEQAGEGEEISKCDPRHIHKYIKSKHLPKKKIMEWLEEEYGIVGDGLIFDSLVVEHYVWLRSHPLYYRKDATFVDLILGEQ